MLAVLVIGALWKTIDLIRAPHDRPLRALAGCLALLAAGHALSLPAVTKALDAATGLGVAKVSYNVLVFAGLYALVAFFVLATGSDRRRLQFDGLLLAAVVLVMIGLMLATAPALRGHTLSSPTMTRPTIAWFYIVGNAYFVYAYLSVGRWALRYARGAASRFLSVALWLSALGLAGLMITSVNRGIWVVVRYAGGPPLKQLNAINWPLSNASFVLVTIGMCLPAIVQAVGAVQSWLLHRRLYREITPLWTAMRDAYPELVLDRGTGGSIHRRFYRRLIECRDGLVRLSPYIAAAAKGRDTSRSSPAELAGYIRTALAIKPAQEEPGLALPAVAIAMLGEDDINSDVRELVGIARALG
ncbi:hypothetical protein D5S17_21035 [Pseudonocardiaceae bacterium YIM PH 21723]|nr:hypothetical protein D5S17_21035 [Pseudonocardiaceae bacterium YIM PH 21723]